MNFYERYESNNTLYYSNRRRRPQGNVPLQLVAMSCMIACISLLIYFME